MILVPAPSKQTMAAAASTFSPLLDRVAVQTLAAAGVFNLFSTKLVIAEALDGVPTDVEETDNWWLDRVRTGRQVLSAPPFRFTNDELSRAEAYAGGKQHFEARCVAVAGANDALEKEVVRPPSLAAPDTEPEFWRNFRVIGMRAWMGVPAAVPGNAVAGNYALEQLDAVSAKVAAMDRLTFPALPPVPAALADGATDAEAAGQVYAFEEIVAALRDHENKFALVSESSLQLMLDYVYRFLDTEGTRKEMKRAASELRVPDPTAAEAARLEALVQLLVEKAEQEANRLAEADIRKRLTPVYESAAADFAARLEAFIARDFVRAAREAGEKKVQLEEPEAEVPEADEEVGAGRAARRPRRRAAQQPREPAFSIVDFEADLNRPFLMEANTVELAEGLLTRQLDILSGAPPPKADIAKVDKDNKLTQAQKDAFEDSARVFRNTSELTKTLRAVVQRTAALSLLSSSLDAARAYRVALLDSKLGKKALRALAETLEERLGTAAFEKNKNVEGLERPVKQTLLDAKLEPTLELAANLPLDAFDAAIAEIKALAAAALDEASQTLADQKADLLGGARALDQAAQDINLTVADVVIASAPKARQSARSAGDRKPDVDVYGGEGNELVDPLLVAVRGAGGRLVALADKLAALLVYLADFDDAEATAQELVRAVCLDLDAVGRKLDGKQPDYIDKKYEAKLKRARAGAPLPLLLAAARDGGEDSDEDYESALEDDDEEEEEVRRAEYVAVIRDYAARSDNLDLYDSDRTRAQIFEYIEDFYEALDKKLPVALNAQKTPIKELVTRLIAADDAFKKMTAAAETTKGTKEEQDAADQRIVEDALDDFVRDYESTVLYRLVATAGQTLEAVDARSSSVDDRQRAQIMMRLIGGPEIGASEFQLARDQSLGGEKFRKNSNPFLRSAKDVPENFVADLVNAVVDSTVAEALAASEEQPDALSNTAGTWMALERLLTPAFDDKPGNERVARLEEITNQWGRISGGVLRFAVQQTPEWTLLIGLTIVTYSGLLDIDPPLRLPQLDREFVAEWARDWLAAIKKPPRIGGPKTLNALLQMPRDLESVLASTRGVLSVSDKERLDQALLNTENPGESVKQLAEIVQRQDLEDTAANLGELALGSELDAVAALIKIQIEEEAESQTLADDVEYYFLRGTPRLSQEDNGSEDEAEDSDAGSESEARLIARALQLTNGDMLAAARLLKLAQ